MRRKGLTIGTLENEKDKTISTDKQILEGGGICYSNQTVFPLISHLSYNSF